MTKHTLKRISKAAERAVLSGEQDHILKALEISAPKKDIRRYRKRLDAAEDWQRYGTTVYNAHGIAFDGIAYWNKRICIRLNSHDYRFQVLCLARFERLTFYLIPIGYKGKQLPNIDLGEGEFQMLVDMANDISGPSAMREYLFELKNPLRQATMDRVRFWREGSHDPAALLNLLEKSPGLPHVFTGTLDAQLRALKRMQDTPIGIYNFVLPKKDATAPSWLISALQAVAFSNEATYQQGPIIVNALEDWVKCYRRLVLVNATRREIIQPILDLLEARDRIGKCGGMNSPLGATQPITMSKGVILTPFALDVDLPAGLIPLTASQQDLLRSAMSQCLSKKFAEEACQKWAEKAHSPTAYRMAGFSAWRHILLHGALQRLFTDTDLWQRAAALCENTQRKEEEAERQREEVLQRAYALVTDPSRYDDKIIDRPGSVTEAHTELDGSAVAFHFQPKQGKDRNCKLLAFIKDSLLRLLKTVGCGEDLYDAFLERCKQSGILDQKNRSIKLGDQTLSAITFSLEKF